MRLLGAIKTAGWQRVYYTDTDCLFGTETLLSALHTFGKFSDCPAGGLRHVDTYNSVVFHGRKHYTIDGKLVCAGLPLLRERQGKPGTIIGVNESVMEALRNHHMPLNLETNRDFTDCLEGPIGKVVSNGRVQPMEVWEK